jgi:hypothetical protein
MASSIEEEAHDIPLQVDAAFQRTLLRSPADEERDASVELVRAHGLAELCRTLFNTSEFLFVP